MGRVAKYKKVKAFDRLHSGGEYVWGSNDGRITNKKRSKTAEKLKQKKLKRRRDRNHNNNSYGDEGGFDIPPSGKDEFDMSSMIVTKWKKPRLDDGLMPSSSQAARICLPTLSSSGAGSKPAAVVSENKVKIGDKTVECNIPQNDREERKMAKVLNIDPKSGKTLLKKNSASVNAKIQGRQEGESMRAFNRRLKEETKLALARDFKNKSAKFSNSKNKNSSQTIDGQDAVSKKERRKEFMKMKKKKKKNGVAYSESGEDLQDNDETEAHSDFITGENAVAAAAAMPSFLDQVEAPPVFNRLPRGAQKKAKMLVRDKDGMDEKSIKAEQNAMEAMRRKVQAQYALVKAKRRKEGSFHL